MSVQPAQIAAHFSDMPAANPGAIPVQAGINVAAMIASGGTVTLDGATPVAVANANVTANSIIIFTLKTAAGTVSPNAPNVLTITPGTGFTVGGTALDTSVYNYAIIG